MDLALAELRRVPVSIACVLEIRENKMSGTRSSKYFPCGSSPVAYLSGPRGVKATPKDMINGKCLHMVDGGTMHLKYNIPICFGLRS